MSDSGTGGPPPTVNITPPKPQGQGKGQRTPSAAQGKRNNRNNNTNPRKQSAHIDGAQSDSVTGTRQHAKRAGRQSQVAAPGAAPAQYNNNNKQNGDANGQKIRPVSMGGPMLSATPGKERAYAQSTFQASPAASALPVPKFFGSKSVPNANVPSSLQARMDSEKTPQDTEESSPEPDYVSPSKQQHAHGQTPLDVFFMADKAEKERKSSPGLNFSPDLAVRPPPVSEPRNPFHTNRQGPFARGINEADGPIISPRTISQGQRPSPSRAHSSPGNGAYSAHQQGDNHEASTQALKDLLFNNINKHPSSTPPRASSNGAPNSHGADSAF